MLPPQLAESLVLTAENVTTPGREHRRPEAARAQELVSRTFIGVLTPPHTLVLLYSGGLNEVGALLSITH